MNFYETKLLDIVPEFMRNDATVRGLCAAGDAMLKVLIDAIHLSWWRKYINELSEKQLDELAKIIGISWFDEKADVSGKRNLLIKCTSIISVIDGTPAAVKYAIKYLFGETEVVNWYEYGGEPYHFEIYANSKLTEDIVNHFQEAINSSKNVRSILDAIDLMRISDERPIIGGNTIGYQICETK